MVSKFIRSAQFRTRTWAESWRNSSDLARIEDFIRDREQQNPPQGSPILFFNASTRIWGLSLNAAFSQLAAWGLRLAGLPVLHYVCNQGMEQCVLGAIHSGLLSKPPCRGCIRLSRNLYSQERTLTLTQPSKKTSLLDELEELHTVKELSQFTVDGLPLGQLCLPSVRWVLRMHSLKDDYGTLELFKRFIRSSAHIASHFSGVVQEVKPRAIVVFNGISYPEAVVREIGMRNDVPVITHEVGVRPNSAFFTRGHATAYPIDIDDDYTLSSEEETKLDRYLSERFGGDFSMAGIHFWPSMEALGEKLTDRLGEFDQAVSVFTNVIFDTSQIHANTTFADMFVWLRGIVEFARENPDTLFVIRAHPDELRPGKESKETVEGALIDAGAFDMPNIQFISPREFINSYELIRRSNLVLVYNSTIGLEATLLRKPVICGGKARYTQYPTVYFPGTRREYFDLATSLLKQTDPGVPDEFFQQARRYAFFQHFLTSLDFSNFLRPHKFFPGYIRFRKFDPGLLDPAISEEIEVLKNGILHNEQFIYQAQVSTGQNKRRG